MTVVRWLWLFAAMGSFAPAGRAAPASSDVPSEACSGMTLAECVDGCERLPERAQVAHYDVVGTEALHVVARSGQRYLAFPHQEGRGCEVYPIGRAVARADGRFGGATKVFALRPPSCIDGSCAIALAVRGKDDRPLAAVRSEADCDMEVVVRPIKLFPDRDSIELVCRSSAAGGWAERRVLFDVAGNALTKLYQLDTGSYQAISQDERKRGECPRAPLGSIRVEKVGPRPQLRVIDPDAATPGNLYNGIGTLPARQLAYDPERREFVATGAPDLPTKVDNHDCRHR